ncbi:hypothetical protein JCM24511_01121 [Saitozyma sp. JCM 24511]|nr:hypothetical protein JCM24511_01121 [Saitozyma sp. JCM 24511]
MAPKRSFRHGGKTKTITPLLEAGGGSRRSSLTSEDGEVLSMTVRAGTGRVSEDGEGEEHEVQDEDEEEVERGAGRIMGDMGYVESAGAGAGEGRMLLGDGVKVVGDRVPRDGWVSFGSFSRAKLALSGLIISQLPKPLLYLLLIPPVILILAPLRLFLASHTALPSRPLLSNGTHAYRPTTLLVSLDGFRPTYLTSHPHLLSNILSLTSQGMRAESMRPVFPTLTFPLHWAMMTGLYPSSSGIIANDFWDPQEGKEFVYTNTDKSWDAGWWWGEPMWSVVERAGRKAGVIMWPGPPTTSSGISASYFVPYRDMAPKDKASQVLEWLDLPLDERPEFIASYFPDVDQAGHAGGPDSDLVEKALTRVDDMVGQLLAGLKERNLGAIVDLVVVSDHGMASTANERVVYLDDVLGDGFDEIEHRDGWPSVGLRFKAGSPTDVYLDRLLQAAEKSNGSFAVYTHETMPDRWHFSGIPRIAPIYVVPHLGWVISNHHEFDVVLGGDYRPKGNHGYDNTLEEMQAIFFAHGPFAEQIKSVAGSRKAEMGVEARGWVSTNPHVLESFANLELYSLVLRLLGLEAYEPAHNGTVGFWDQYIDST